LAIVRIAIVTDLHVGWHNDSLVFHDYFMKFYNNIFFPTLKQEGIKTIVIGGDLWDRRKYINFHILNRARTELLTRLNDYETHVLIGNHDAYFKSDNSVNSVRELCSEYSNFRIYEETQEVKIGGLRMLFVPWLNPTNTAPALDFIGRSTCEIVIGHLELAGFHYDRLTLCKHGLDKALFKKFKKVYSGHFHTQSIDGNIQYLGSPYELTHADIGDERGFHIFDTETLELTFIKNPYRMFHRITYDDRDPTKHAQMLAQDFSPYEKTQVKLIVAHKTDPYLYDRWRTLLENANPDDLKTVETFNLNIDEAADEQFGDFEMGEIVIKDTQEVLHNYVDAVQMEIDKERLKGIIDDLYHTALRLAA
jgi:DNA repair exonuclease SbcCD nuclease subunit